MFDHYIVTRFNLRKEGWSKTKNNGELLTDEWMSHRFELFFNYCFPSVIGQKNQQFKWFLYFDTTTKTSFRNKIEKEIENVSNIFVFYVDGMDNFLPHLKGEIHELSNHKDYIITTRIDNDDAISNIYVDEIQNQFDKQEFLAIDVVKGYTIQVQPKTMIGKKQQMFNPFISLIEKKDNLETVWCYGHTMWKKESRMIHYTDKRLWMSVIHTMNKVNEFDGYGRVSNEIIGSEFKLSSSITDYIHKNALGVNKWFLQSIKNKWYVFYVYYSKWLKKKIGLYKK